MAQQMHSFIRVTDGRGGALTVGVRFNDQNLRATGVEVTNTSTFPAYVEVTYSNNLEVGGFDIPAAFSGGRGFNRNLTMETETDPDTGETNYGLLGIQQWAAGFVVV